MIQKVLCEACAAVETAATPLGMWSVDGCDACDNGGAGHQVFEVSA